MGKFLQRSRLALQDSTLKRPRWAFETAREPAPLWLDKNENFDDELSKLTTKLLSQLSPKAINTYPELGSLYKKLASWVGVGAECLVLTAGSDGAIRSVFDAFIEPGDLVVHTSPTFAMYPIYCQIYGAKTKLLKYRGDKKGPQLELSEVLAAIKSNNVKLLCLPNPDSPTGTVFTPDEMEEILRCALAEEVLVLVDEAYHPYYFSSVVPLLSKFPNLIVARTFSKAWGLAGARVGYSIANGEISEILNKVRAMYEVGALGASLVEAMLPFGDAMLASVERVKAGRLYFGNEMQKLGFNVLQSEGNFIHVAFGSQGHSVHEALKGKVLYRLDSKEECLSGFSRFTVAPTGTMKGIVDCVDLACAVKHRL